MSRVDSIPPFHVFEAAVRQNQVLPWCVIELRPVRNSLNIKKSVNDFGFLIASTNHKQNIHHEANLVPQESTAPNHALEHVERGISRVSLDELSSVDVDAAHVISLLVVGLEDRLILFAKVAEVVQT
jgi:hypothetical protein